MLKENQKKLIDSYKNLTHEEAHFCKDRNMTGKSIHIGLEIMRLIECASEHDYKLMICRPSGNVEVIIRKLPPPPDPVIVIDECGSFQDAIFKTTGK